MPFKAACASRLAIVLLRPAWRCFAQRNVLPHCSQCPLMNEYLLRPFLLWSQEIFGFGSYGLYGLENGSSKNFQVFPNSDPLKTSS